jgi:hypothetical protein
LHILVAFVALGLLVVVLFPLVSRRLRAARRERAVHFGGSCHWYANYDEELRYEPKRRSDIVRLTRDDLRGRGYEPTGEVQLVPRTFRLRVPGDRRIRLWKSGARGVPPIWICEWATDPVRLAIGERESVPGVETGPLPEPDWDAPAPPRSAAAGEVLGSWVSAEALPPGSDAMPESAADWGDLALVAGPGPVREPVISTASNGRVAVDVAEDETVAPEVDDEADGLERVVTGSEPTREDERCERGPVDERPRRRRRRRR